MNEIKFRPTWFTVISNYGHVEKEKRLVTTVDKTKVKVMSFTMVTTLSFRGSVSKMAKLL